MKKILAICLVLVMMVSLSVTAFAAPNGFVSSPSADKGPTVEDFKPSDDKCDAELIITPYADREELPAELLKAIEDAFKEVTEAKDLTTLNEALAKLAKQKGIAAENLLVSDLFDVRAEGCDDHDGHFNFEITVKADLLKNFVGLLHRKNGNWELVSNAKVVKNGTALSFTVDSLSPFAIVVNKSATSPQTSDNSMTNIFVILAAVSALAIVVICKKGKEQTA